MSDIQACGLLRSKTRGSKRVFDGMASASSMIGKLESGFDMMGVTKGQFSLADLIAAILDQTGPAVVKICTWTAADSDLRSCFALLHHGHLTELKFVFDYGIEACRDYVDAIVQEFGSDAFRITRTHAKFCIVRNERFSIAIRTSMNFNWNPRFEFFEITDDVAKCGFLENLFDEAFERGSHIGDSLADKRAKFNQFDLTTASTLGW